MILCRHALFHNTNSAVLSILQSISISGAKWFAATTLRPIDPFVPSIDSEVMCVFYAFEMCSHLIIVSL
jgi:hypothetical protein